MWPCTSPWSSSRRAGHPWSVGPPPWAQQLQRGEGISSTLLLQLLFSLHVFSSHLVTVAMLINDCALASKHAISIAVWCKHEIWDFVLTNVYHSHKRNCFHCMYTVFSTYPPLNSLCELSRERVWLWATSFNSSCITTLSWIPASLQAESWTLINQLLLQISFWASSSHGNTSNVIIPWN